MAKSIPTRRQKDIARLLRERKLAQQDKLRAFFRKRVSKKDF